jgi:hypothetical protein
MGGYTGEDALILPYKCGNLYFYRPYGLTTIDL